MADVVLHIGLHKTGTTTLQDSFAANADLLARHGIHYPRLAKATGHHWLACDWNPHLPAAYRIEGGGMAALQALARDHAAGDGTLVLSSEELSRADPAFRPDMDAIRAALAPFARIRVVCTLRAQWRFLQSVWLEMAKHAAPSISPLELIRKAIAGPQAHGLWMDPNALYDHLLESFTAEEIVFLDHGTVQAEPEGILGAMLRLLDGPAPDTMTQEPSNVSGEPLALWLAAAIATPAPAPPDLHAATLAALHEQFGPKVRSTLFTVAEREAVTRAFAPLNAAFAERLASLQPGFAITGEQPPAGLIHREQAGGDIWRRCARRMFHQAHRPTAT